MPDSPLHLRPLPVLLVFVGGAVGTVSRYLLGLVIPSLNGFPLPTFLVNLVGAFTLGVLLEGLLRGGNDVGWRQRVRLLCGPGFLGGFTTYSSLSVETVLLTENGQYVMGGGYAVASLVLGVGAAAAGVWVAANVFRVPTVIPGSEHSTITSTRTLHLAQPARSSAPEPAGSWVDPDAEQLDDDSEGGLR
ncbi:fluoride efflux transporter FluC [Gryllotalpicola protaetiae]|uniref:Fluoride-specific ion channel FluC n=1 Tax=Gryllotalpicola protaetiae TaxID=2419771 RepID=A0A387BRN8_9MICO|nr:CrcB family protein [Gryllotalpicola protaetiae]AYG03646.1 CrcB family protein [Gryllotalpicola protaetiae]